MDTLTSRRADEGGGETREDVRGAMVVTREEVRAAESVLEGATVLAELRGEDTGSGGGTYVISRVGGAEGVTMRGAVVWGAGAVDAEGADLLELREEDVRLGAR